MKQPWPRHWVQELRASRARSSRLAEYLPYKGHGQAALLLQRSQVQPFQQFMQPGHVPDKTSLQILDGLIRQLDAALSRPELECVALLGFIQRPKCELGH